MFQLSRSANHWFRKIEGKQPFDRTKKMDIYYLCLLIGILSGKNTDLVDAEPSFVKSWPGDYKNNLFTIITIFLNAELERFGISKNDEPGIKKHLVNYLTNEDIRLSEMAIKQLNNYSYGGFIELKKEMINEPEDVTVFLIDYYKILKKTIK